MEHLQYIDTLTMRKELFDLNRNIYIFSYFYIISFLPLIVMGGTINAIIINLLSLYYFFKIFKNLDILTVLLTVEIFDISKYIVKKMNSLK